MFGTNQVQNISAQTTETHLTDFFTYARLLIILPLRTPPTHLTHSFCGKITSIAFDRPSNSATIHFEKPSAVKTALMLNGGTLDGAQLVVSAEKEHADADVADEAHEPGTFEQSDKPRTASASFPFRLHWARDLADWLVGSIVAAEYLARGYTLSDSILQRAIEIDNEKGISSRFLSYIHSLDSTLGAPSPPHFLSLQKILWN